MTWHIREEWIDLAASRHVVIFHNPDVLVEDYRGSGKMVPQEHHLIYEFGPWKDHATGTMKANQPQIEDFAQHKVDTLAALQAHHQLVMQHRDAHKQVRLATGPKR
jgi:hypothetical protein